MEGFDYDVEGRLVREKGETLVKVSQNIDKINHVMRETQILTFKQGEDLDLISDEIDKTKANMESTN